MSRHGLPWYDSLLWKGMEFPSRPFGALCALLAAPLLCAEPLATIDGEPIEEADVATTGEEWQTKQRLFELRYRAIQGAISQALLRREAEKREISVDDLIQAEIGSKVGVPTNREVQDFYEAQKDKINRPLKDVREQVIRTLQEAKASSHLNDYIASLRVASEVEVLLEPMRLPVSLENVRSEGPEDAAVTVVEFADFQCPYCRRAQATLTALREEYKDRVRWVFKDLPLPDIHPEAVRAAMAARCADQQKKFWPFQAKLFELELFTDENYENAAKEVGVNAKKLMECLNEGAVEQDVFREATEARSFGIQATPLFLINGIQITGARPIGEFRAVIDQELKRAEKPL